MEPLNKGLCSQFVLCREVVCFSEILNVLTIWEMNIGNPEKGLFLLCPLPGGFFIGGSTVLTYTLLMFLLITCYNCVCVGLLVTLDLSIRLIVPLLMMMHLL